MNRLCCTLCIAFLCAASTMAAPPVIDGRAIDPLYGDALAVQNTQTGYGDASIGRPDVCDGSEIDNLYGVVYGNYLYLVFAGNLQTNGNRLEIFFDSVAGGQNVLSGDNPTDFGTLGPKGPGTDPNGPGLEFASGFEADYYFSVNASGDPVDIYVDYAKLYVDANEPGYAYYLGVGEATCAATGGALVPPPDPNVPTGVFCTIDNRNAAGVTGGFDFELPADDVFTGVELAIPLALLGNPTGNIKVTAYIGDNSGQFASNQVMAGIGGATVGNLAGGGDPDEWDHIRQVDLGNFFDHEPVTITNPPAAAVGACCVGTACSIETQTYCENTLGGSYLGDNVSCAGNPCDAIDAGRCCIDDGLGGLCMILTQAECEAMEGYVSWEVGLDCSGCPCLQAVRGACCLPTADPNGLCDFLSEADCLAQDGNYLGDYVACGPDSCVIRACCIDGVCYEMNRDECWSAGGGIFYDNVLSCSDPNFGGCGFSQPHVNGEYIGWDPGTEGLPMTQDPPNSNKWVLTYTVDPNAFVGFKITNGVDWSGAVPGSNAWIYADPNGVATYLYDGNIYVDGWVPETNRIGALPTAAFPRVWNVVGNFMDELGGGDWNNGDPAFQMTEVSPWHFEYEATGIAPGNYEGKCTAQGTWDAIGEDSRNVNADNEEFEITDTTDTLKISCKPLEGIIKVEVIPAGPALCPGDANCDGFINFRDIDYFVAAQNDNVAAWEALFGGTPPCDFLNNDANSDGFVNFRDIDPFVALQNTTCP